MEVFFALVIGAGIVVLVRLYTKIRDLQNLKQQDWDTRAIDRLRKQGSDPFQPHEVDFFFALPNENACRAVNAQLEAEGYAVDIKAVPENPDFAFSLHARKSMRLSVPDMQDISRRFTTLAASQGGRYDGWAADVVKTA
jgi:hypothetical protein